MTVRGTENFVYYLDKILGAGSTGTVYFGRHKRNGDPCAAKLFTRSESLSKVRVKQNEIDFMRMLDHTNIVRFLAIEEDTRMKESVLLMELCTEGSLQKLLSEPENVFGLNEDLFLKCFTQFMKGLDYLMLHGIIHRDVKPGNILCSKCDDGSLIFKLTDFGVTREMAGNVSANALFGTEEYLHPETYRRVFLEKVPLPAELEQNAEIWSIGVTIYHIATGQLPFQGYGGRSNRETMHRIISTKDHGVISGIQTESDGNITWRRDLPETCSASRGLRDKLVPIIANTVETLPRLQWTFEQLFPACESLYKSTVVVLFYVVTCSYIRIYLEAANTSFEALKDTIFRQTNVAVNDIVLIYNNKLLVEPVSSAGSRSSSSIAEGGLRPSTSRTVETAQPFTSCRAETGSHPSTSRSDEADSSVQIFPHSSEETPFVLTTRALWEYQQIQTLQPVKPSMTSSEPTLASDAVWACDATAFCYRYLLSVQFLNRVQVFIQQTQIVLIDELKSLVEIVQLSVGEMIENYTAVRANVCQTDRAVRQFLADLLAKFMTPSARSSPNKDLENFISKCVKDLNNLMKHLMDSLSKMEKLKSNVELNAGKINVPPTTVSLQATECEQRRCIHKVRQWFQQSRDVWQKFTEDKKRQLTYNEDQIHELKLDELEDTVANEVTQHCIPQTHSQHREFHLWFSGLYLKVKRNIEDCDQLMKQLRDHIKHLSLEQEQVRHKLFDYHSELMSLLTKGAKTKSTSFLSTLFTRSSTDHHTVSRSPTEPQISRSSEQFGEHTRSLNAVNSSREHDNRAIVGSVPPKRGKSAPVGTIITLNVDSTSTLNGNNNNNNSNTNNLWNRENSSEQVEELVSIAGDEGRLSEHRGQRSLLPPISIAHNVNAASTSLVDPEAVDTGRNLPSTSSVGTTHSARTAGASTSSVNSDQLDVGDAESRNNGHEAPPAPSAEINSSSDGGQDQRQGATVVSGDIAAGNVDVVAADQLDVVPNQQDDIPLSPVPFVDLTFEQHRRLATFVYYPIDARPRPHILARCGFVFIGGHCVRCTLCNMTVNVGLGVRVRNFNGAVHALGVQLRVQVVPQPNAGCIHMPQ